MCKYLKPRFYTLAALRAAMSTPSTDSDDASQDRVKRPSDDWDLGAGFAGAAHLLDNGWPEGVAMMQKMQAGAPAQAFDAVAQWRLDYAGQRPCIPAFLGGDMRAMYRRGSDIVPRKLLKLGFVVSASYLTSAADLLGRAIAYCELIQQLEQSGVDVEVYAVRYSGRRARAGQKSGDLAAILANHFLIKPAGQHVQPDIFLGTIGHPAFFRRCTFRVAELYERDFFNGHPDRHNYGKTLEAFNYPAGLCPDIQYYQIQPSDLETARDAIQRAKPTQGTYAQ